MSLLRNFTDVFVVGGGPAGLAAAIALRRAGMSVVVADAGQPGIDKACGEGLMPDGLAALDRLGVRLPADCGHAIRGITFRTGNSAATAYFARGNGLGIRRTALHKLLVGHAAALGVQMLWGVRADVIAHGKVSANGAEWLAHWIVGADGQRSRVRQSAQLDRAPRSQRYGFRRHFSLAPWTDCVEVHWAPEGQANVTPIGKDAVCVALAMEDKTNRMADLPRMFPALAKRLSGCQPVSTQRGAMTVCRRLPRVTRGSIALIGEAAGSIDAVTGEGLALTFQQAIALGESLPLGNAELYEAKNRQLGRIPFAMSKAMVFLGRHPRLQSRFIQASAKDPALFSDLMAVHLGMRSPFPLSAANLASFGWNFAIA